MFKPDFTLFIANRYLFSKKSHNAINIISIISAIGVCLGTMALIVVLSVFNGFEHLAGSLLNSFDSDLKITAVKGKTFDASKTVFNDIKKIPGIRYYSEIVEENALLKYNEKQFIGVIKGTDQQFINNSGIDTMLTEGDAILVKDSIPYAIVGQGIANNLGVNTNDFFSPLMVYIPKRGITLNTVNMDDAFRFKSLSPSSVFAIQQDFDAKYVLVPLSFVRDLLNYTTQASSIEIGLNNSVNGEQAKEQIANLLGSDFKIQNRYEQHETIYKIMRTEKWAVFFILAFILVIATFNLIGSLTMLIIEKQKDISILRSMGANRSSIRKLFLTEGLLISFIGAVIGLLLGYLICYLQDKFGIIKLQGSGSFVVDYYPIKLKLIDFINVIFAVTIVGFLSSWYSVTKLIKKEFSIRLTT